MHRPIVYYGALARALDVLTLGQNAMVGLAKLAEATLGTGTSVDGFTCTPTAPASLSVNIGAGQVYQVANLESTAISLLQQDSHSVVKQGLLADALALTLTVPTTPGYAQYVLVQTQYSDSDDTPTVLNYYNAASPSVPLVGPGGNGPAQSTVRKGIAQVTAKYGIAATAGSQVAPTPDAGWAPLFLITLTYGQTAITAGNIAIAANAPFIGTKLPQIPAYVRAGAVPQIISSPLLWVRSDGNDANDGSTNTPGSAFATIGAAFAAATRISGSSGTITIRLGVPATYSYSGAPGIPGGSYLLLGDNGNPSGYIISTTGIGAIVTSVTLSGVTVQNNATTSTTLSGSTAGTIGAQYTIFQSVAGNTNYHIGAFSGGTAIIGPGCVFASSMGGIGVGQSGGLQVGPYAVTIQGSPTWAVGAFVAQAAGTVGISSGQSGTSFSGSANGPRYNANSNGVIVTNGSGASFFPGSQAGTTATGGQYI